MPSVAVLDRFSQVIVVGEAVLSQQTTSTNLISINVSRVIKGQGIDTAKQIQVQIEVNKSCTIAPGSGPTTAIWFLNVLSDGKWAFSDHPTDQTCHPFNSDYEMPAGDIPDTWKYSSDLPSNDKLGYELAWSIDAHAGNGPVAFVWNPHLLQGVRKRTAIDIYKRLSASTVPNVHLVGVLGLGEDGDSNAIADLRTNMAMILSQPSRKSYTVNGREMPLSYPKSATGASPIELQIAKSIGRIVNPQDATVRQLGMLLGTQSTSPVIRASAAHALQNIHTPLALTYLAPLLNSSDRELRGYAIGALACFANAVPILDPSSANGGLDLSQDGPFKTSETISHFVLSSRSSDSSSEEAYVTFWRTWWFRNQSAIEAP
jgi:hypothetical protein